MANFPKFHGITLAANSWIENANFERLAADPVPVSAGRVWFNTTDKALKYSSLDANGEVVIRTIGSVEDMQAANPALQAALSSEISRAQAAEAALQAALDAEIQARAAADSQLTSDLAAEVSRATAAEATLTSDLAAEVARAQAAEASLASDLAAEAAARLNAEAALRSAINAQQFTYVSDTADLSHTINHGLNSEHILFNIMVEGVDGKFRNDIVPVEELDFNSFRIELTEARRVKVAVRAMRNLAMTDLLP